VEGYRRRWGKGGEMTQTLYAHVNKIKIKKKPKGWKRMNKQMSPKMRLL
jgi:hypothetical protein